MNLQRGAVMQQRNKESTAAKAILKHIGTNNFFIKPIHFGNH